MKHFDAIVIGIGAMGSATLYHMAKRGWNVLGIEQFEIPHEMGSSHGLTRIIRLAYYEDPSYVPLLRRTYKLWDELEREAGEKLFYQTGSLDMGPEDSDVFAGSIESCLEHDLEYQVLNSSQLSERFPGYQMPAKPWQCISPKAVCSYPSAALRLMPDWRKNTAHPCARANASSAGTS